MKLEAEIGLSSENIQRLELIRGLVNRKWEDSKEFDLPFIKPNGIYNEKLEGLLKRLLLPDERSSYSLDQAFTDNEKFLLIAAVWLKDLGMCIELDTDAPEGLSETTIRKNHHERSASFIRNSPELDMLTALERNRLSTICYLHRKYLPIPKNLYDKIRLIIAYIRLADALIIPERSSGDEKDITKYFVVEQLDAVSKFQWLKSYYLIYAGPSGEGDPNLVVRLKKPINWDDDSEKRLQPLKQILATEIGDILDSVKDILAIGKVKYDLPAYFDIKWKFDVSYLDNTEMDKLKKLLGIIELFNPTISPNSGRIIDIVLNQMENITSEGIIDNNSSVDAENAALKVKDNLRTYLEEVLDPLLQQRPCHAYLWNVREALTSLCEPDKGSKIIEIQKTLKALSWWRTECIRNLASHVISKEIIKRDDNILLYGYSGTVVKVLQSLEDEIKKSLSVYVCACSTKDNHRINNRLIYSDGAQYIKELKKSGIGKIYFVADSCTSNLFMPMEREKGKAPTKVSKVIFGTNAVGSLKDRGPDAWMIFHGLGHQAVADTAKMHGAEVYIFTEGLKVMENMQTHSENQRAGAWYPTDELLQDQFREIEFYNPREDVVPLENITAVFTEMGCYCVDAKRKDQWQKSMESLSIKPQKVLENYDKRYESKL